MSWEVLYQILILLAASLLLGTLAERFKQSAIVGYLLAGTIVGPHVLGLVRDHESVETVAELGAALLLFTIGLEFSVRQMRKLGAGVLVAGLLQVTLTTLIAYGLLVAFTHQSAYAISLGIMLAMSSTATVMRLLADTASIETPFGRNAMGILLLQDALLLPATLLVAASVQGGNMHDMVSSVGRMLLFMLAMVAAFYLVLNIIAPRLLSLKQWALNRELPIMMAAVLAIGSAYAAHSIGISTAIGAFIAGLMLGESPFAVQVRADVAPLRTLLVTIFFGSIGMLANPAWTAQNWMIVAIASACVLLLKSNVVWGILAAMRCPIGIALASGMCLANVGEFSFVIAQIASRGGLLSENDLNIIVSVTLISLIVAPYLVKYAPSAASAIESRRRARRPLEQTSASMPQSVEPRKDLILIAGFGPAGQRVAEALMGTESERLVIIELSTRSAGVATRYGLRNIIGSASQLEVLERAGIHRACVVVITVPDPATSQQVIMLCRALNPNVRLLVRARYHAYRWELQMAGADVVVDEEEQMGLRLAAIVRRSLAGDESE